MPESKRRFSHSEVIADYSIAKLMQMDKDYLAELAQARQQEIHYLSKELQKRIAAKSSGEQTLEAFKIIANHIKKLTD